MIIAKSGHFASAFEITSALHGDLQSDDVDEAVGSNRPSVSQTERERVTVALLEPLCKYCDQRPEKFAKAHVIPRSFFKLVKKEASYAVFFQARKEQVRTDFHQAGIYDSGILCVACEAAFTNWDTHGYDVLSKTRGDDEALRTQEGITCGVIPRNLVYQTFKMFLLSVLWRASVSSHLFFSGIDLGPHERRIRSILKTEMPLGPEQYSAMLLLPVGQPFRDTILMPWRSRIDGVWFCRLYFPNVIALIKVDERPTPEALAPLQLRPDGDNYMMFHPHHGSPEDRFFRGLHRFMKENDLFEQPSDASGTTV